MLSAFVRASGLPGGSIMKPGRGYWKRPSRARANRHTRRRSPPESSMTVVRIRSKPTAFMASPARGCDFGDFSCQIAVAPMYVPTFPGGSKRKKIQAAVGETINTRPNYPGLRTSSAFSPPTAVGCFAHRLKPLRSIAEVGGHPARQRCGARSALPE